MAEGGVVTGPTSAVIGEGSENEAVLPLSRLEGLLNTTGDGRVVAEIQRLRRELTDAPSRRGTDDAVVDELRGLRQELSGGRGDSVRPDDILRALNVAIDRASGRNAVGGR